MIYRPATANDIEQIAAIYDRVHDAEAEGRTTTGWERGVYPTADTARAALDRGDLYVCEEEGRILASAVINQLQVDVYADGKWAYDVPDDQILVIHTLSVDPELARGGIGSGFVGYYEQLAAEGGTPYLRLDTNVNNAQARGLYRKLGFTECDFIPTVFNGIPGTTLVLIEKKVGDE